MQASSGGTGSQLAVLPGMDETLKRAGLLPATHTHGTGQAAQLGTSATHIPRDTLRMEMHLQRTLSQRALWEAFSHIQDSKPNTLPCELELTASPAKSRQESRLQPGGKGCWDALSYSSPCTQHWGAVLPTRV